MRHVLMIAGLLGLLAGRPVRGQCTYSIVATTDSAPCGFFDGGVAPRDMNDSGLVVATGACLNSILAIWDSTSGAPAQFLDPPGFVFSVFTGVSNTGVMCGYAGNVNDDVSFETAFVRTDDKFAWIPPPFGGSNFSKAVAINDDGVVAGTWGYAAPTTTFREAFVWTNGVAKGLNEHLGVTRSEAAGINCRGDVVGRIGTGDELRGFVYYSNGQSRILPPLEKGQATIASFIDDDRRIFGFGYTSRGTITEFAFSYDGSGFDTYPPLAPLTASRPTASNARTQVVGLSSNGPFDTTGTLWVDGEPFSLLDLLEEDVFFVAPPAAILDDGRMVAAIRRYTDDGYIENFNRAAILAPTGMPAGDITLDCAVDHHDLRLLFEHWGSETEWADLTGDGHVGFDDLIVLLSKWSG